MRLHRLDTRAAVRGAIEAHGRAWRVAYADLLPASVLDRVTVEPDVATVEEWLDRLPGDDDPGEALGVTVDGSVRGYLFVRWGETKQFVGPDEAGLKELYVHPDWWGGGLGTSLLGRGVEQLPPAVETLVVEALAGNEVGQSFYESRGFRRDATDEIQIDGASYETVVYRRPVSPRAGV